MTRKYDISLEKIPKGILLCLNNSERLLVDSNILVEKNRMPSAVALITIAIEEFGKALWLSGYLNQMACVRHDVAKNIFRVHSDKIKIFYDWLKMQGREPSSHVNKFLKTIEGNDDEQDYKLRMIYVNFENLDAEKLKNVNNRTTQDWELDDWKDPQYIKDLALSDADTYNISLQQRHKVLKEDLEWGINKFRSEVFYETVMKCQPSEVVDGRQIMSLLNKLSLKSSLLQLKTTPNEIELIIRPGKQGISDNTLSDVKNILMKKYPGVEIKVSLE